jgi:hypothetical protein
LGQVSGFLLSAFFGGGAGFETEAVVAGFNDVAVMGETIEHGGCHLGVTDHLMMPQMLTGESLRSGWLISITRCMAVACPSVVAVRDAVPV